MTCKHSVKFLLACVFRHQIYRSCWLDKLSITFLIAFALYVYVTVYMFMIKKKM